MRYIVQSTSTKLSGKRYERGEVVPPELATRSLLDAGILSAIPEPAVDALASGAGRYDPGEHTVDHVLEYAAGHPDQAAAILEAEEAGGARTTLTGPLEALAADHAARGDTEAPVGPVGGLPGSHLPAPGAVLDLEPGPVGEPSDPDRLRVSDRREVPGDHLSAGEAELLEAEEAAAVGEPSDPDAAEAHRRELPGDHLTASEASGDLTGDAARGATRADVGDARTDRMRENAGTDLAGDPNPSAPVPDGPFDPQRSSAAQVLAHADAHPEDVADLIAAERAGKARKGLLDDLTRRAPNP